MPKLSLKEIPEVVTFGVKNQIDDIYPKLEWKTKQARC